MKTREQVDLALLDDNPWQPRQAIDQDGLQELVESIRHLDVLQAPLGRRAKNGRVQLAFGHRRVAACRQLHQEGARPAHIDMDVADISDEDMAVLALTENERRKQLTQIEVVRAHKRAIDETALTVQALAQQLGLDRSTLSNNLRVLELPALVLEHVESGALSLTSAREFLVLQNNDHAHTRDMQRVVDQIAGTFGRSGAPDWSRRHVRELICERVSHNEEDFRPLGPRLAQFEGGAAREATFDVEMFAAERPATLHTIPAEDSAAFSGPYKYESSRTWTCDVKAWRGWQTRATREATKEAVAAGGEAATAPAKAPSRDKQFEQVLAADPVWKKIITSRETAGPDRPVTDEEREQLGTRAKFRELDYNTKFWKVLQKGGYIRPLLSENGGNVPPWFLDLKECQLCTIGAAWAKSSRGYPLDKPTLVCFNQDHYREKLEAGEADYRAKLEAQKKGLNRQDLKLSMQFIREMEPLSVAACRALATSLVAATPKFEMQHPVGEYHQDWSYESGATARARELLGLELNTGGRNGAAYLENAALEALERVAPGDLRELVASLMVHHHRLAGKIEEIDQAYFVSGNSVSQGNAQETVSISERSRPRGLRCANCKNDALPGESRCEDCKGKRRRGRTEQEPVSMVAEEAPA